MLLGHGAIGQFGVAEALPSTVVNAGTVDAISGIALGTVSAGTLTMIGTALVSPTGPGITSTTGAETVTAGATFSVDGSQFTANIGDETVLGEAFQNLISFSVGSPNFFLWNEVDDTADATWIDVEPGSTD